MPETTVPAMTLVPWPMRSLALATAVSGLPWSSSHVISSSRPSTSPEPSVA